MNILHRANLLGLSGMLALAGLAGIAPAAHACSFADHFAGCPTLISAGGPGQVAVNMNPPNYFAPGATVRVEALTPNFASVLATGYPTVNSCGQLSENVADCNSGYWRMDVDNYKGTVWMMADLLPDATHPAPNPYESLGGVVTVGPLATLSAFAEGPATGSPGQPLLCSVTASGSGFPPGQKVDLKAYDNNGHQQGPTVTVQADGSPTGNFNSVAGPSFTYTGPGSVVAHPQFVGQDVVQTLNLCGSGAMPITGTGGGGGGGGTITGGSGGTTGGASGGFRNGGHAAE
jgi:hypothetical protein